MGCVSLRLVTSPMGAVVKYCDEYVYVCVCLSVCPTGYLWNHTRNLNQIFCAYCLWPWLGPTPAGWQKPSGKGQFWGFFPHWQCTVQHSIWDPYKNGWTGQHAVWHDEWAWCVTWQWWSPKGKVQFLGENVPNIPTSLTPLVIVTLATKDRFRLNVLIYRKVGQNSILYY